MTIHVDIIPIWHGNSLDAVMLGKTDILDELPPSTLAEIREIDAREQAEAEIEARLLEADSRYDGLMERLP